MTPTDVRDYKAHLVTVEHRAPATVNRRLAALRKFFAWAKGDGRVTRASRPTWSRACRLRRGHPKSLDKREVDRLIRMAERAARSGISPSSCCCAIPAYGLVSSVPSVLPISR